MRSKKIKFLLLLATIPSLIFLNGCGMGADARQFPPEAEKRIAKNIEEGRGFRLSDSFGKKGSGSAEFDFASSNELWRASLDTIDFMPLVSANYSGGIIITDWYSSGGNLTESLKISIRFLTNEIRSDALDIKVFYKKCSTNESCAISEKSGNLVAELKKKILRRASTYEKVNKDKKKGKPYKVGKNLTD